MNNANLILDIGADVSQFEASLSEVRNRIKEITKDIESASGAKLAELNFDLTGLERTEETLMRFGQFAEGTIGALKNELATLKQERLEIKVGNVALLEDYNRKIQETTTEIKRLESLGQTKVENVVPQSAIDSIEYFKELINELKSRRASISVNTQDAEERVAALNKQISIYKENISNIENLGKIEEVIDPNSIQGLRKQLSDLENIKIKVNVNGEAELALLNSQIAEIQDKIKKANNLTFDPQGQITQGASKARQSITNLGLVLQDLPFGFIAIQNNIPNLIQSFASLQQEAKTLGVTTGSLLRQQFQGTTGTILGLGLAVSAVTSIITYAVQEYGSLGNALDALTGKTISFDELNKNLAKSFAEVSSNTAGEIANLESLVSILTDVNSTKAQQFSAQKKINDEYPALLAFIEEENFQTEDSIKLIGERLKLIAQQIKLQGRSEALIKLIGESAVEGEKALKRIFDFNNNDLSFLDQLTIGFRGLATGLPGLAGQVKVLSGDFNNAAKASQFYTNQLNQNNEALAEVDGLIKQIEESLDKSRKKQTEQQKLEEAAARKRLKALEDYKKALNAFNQLKIEVPKILDEKKVIEDKINTLKKYGDILLDTNKYDFERADAIKRIIATDKEYFKNLNLQTSSLSQVKGAIDDYVASLVNLLMEAEKRSKIKFKFELPKTDQFLKDVEGFYKFEQALKRLEDVGQIILDPKSNVEERTEALKKLQSEQKLVFDQDAKYFDNLQIGISSTEDITNAILGYGAALQQALIDKKAISELFDSSEIKTQIESIKQLSKGLPKELVPDFKFYEEELTRIFTLEFLKTGKPIDPEIIKERINTALNVAKDTVKKAQINKALGELFGTNTAEIPITEQIDNIINSVKKFEETIANDLEKPFRNFFDTLLEDGEVNFKAFGDLFKDMIKRMMSQLIASGIAKLITSILFPEKAVLGAVTGVANGTGGPTGILKFITDLFGGKKGAVNNVNFGGVGNGGLQLAGQVVFTQRGSDLVGVLNRTNSTINRIG